MPRYTTKEPSDFAGSLTGIYGALVKTGSAMAGGVVAEVTDHAIDDVSPASTHDSVFEPLARGLIGSLISWAGRAIGGDLGCGIEHAGSGFTGYGAGAHAKRKGW